MTTIARRFNPIRIPWARRAPTQPAARYHAFLSALRRVGAIREERMTEALMHSLFCGVEFEGRRVLDIGGGEGVYSFYAAASGASEVVCLEPEAAGSIGGETDMFSRIRGQLPH